MAPGDVPLSPFSWNALLARHVKSDQGQKALELFKHMREEGVKVDSATFVTLANACASIASLAEGKNLHAQICDSGLESNLVVANSLLDMYVKCGSIENACQVFNDMPKRNMVSWTALLSGYVKCGQAQGSLALYRRMQEEGMKPDPSAFATVANAIASLGAMEEGRRLHGQIIESGCQSDMSVANSLIDMYAKCGSIEDARKVYNEMRTRDVISWTSMLRGFALHGLGKEAVQFFEETRQANVKKNPVTFACLLSACSHGDLVDQGIEYFERMRLVYNVAPTSEHYVCLVELLGRAGRLQEAEDTIKNKLSTFNNTELLLIAWRSLLGACRNHGNLEIGERIANLLVESDPEHPAAYEMLFHIYTAAGKLANKETIEKKWRERSVKKQPGQTWMEVNSKVHSFVTDGQSHPEIDEIHALLKGLYGKIVQAGYEPYTRFGVCEEDKIHSLRHHSVKLAMAFGLISTPAGTPLRIHTNERMCADCHAVTKVISKVEERVMIVRDATRFHRFQDAVCSCAEYW